MKIPNTALAMPAVCTLDLARTVVDTLSNFSRNVHVFVMLTKQRTINSTVDMGKTRQSRNEKDRKMARKRRKSTGR